jgi:hypothetical protein
MNASPLKALNAAVLLALAATGVQSAQAAAPLVSGSVQLNGLTFQLIDLNPDDGIAPSFTLTSPAGLNYSDVVGSTDLSTSPVFNWATGSASPLPSSNSASTKGLSTLTTTPSSLALTSKLLQQDLTTDTASYPQQYANGPDLIQRTDTQTTTGAMSSADLTYYKDGVSRYDMDGNWVRNFGGTLSANTALIITGQSTLNARIDRASLSDAAAAVGSSLNAGEDVSYQGYASAMLYLRITDGDTGNTPIYYNAPAEGQFNATFDSNMVLQARTGTPGVVISDTTGESFTDAQVDQSLTQRFSLVAFNSGGTERNIGFVLDARTTAKWDVTKLSTTTVITPNPDWVPGTPTPGIPEPSTYALMGLGLVGIAAAARRRQPQA